MQDLYLKAKTEKELIDFLPFFRGKNEDDKDIWLTGGQDYALDIIGSVVKVAAVYGEPKGDGDLEVVTPAIMAEGFHANLRCSDEIKAKIPESIIIAKPKNPKRVWF